MSKKATKNLKGVSLLLNTQNLEPLNPSVEIHKFQQNTTRVERRYERQNIYIKSIDK
jgi:hypothetical protein